MACFSESLISGHQYLCMLVFVCISVCVYVCMHKCDCACVFLETHLNTWNSATEGLVSIAIEIFVKASLILPNRFIWIACISKKKNPLLRELYNYFELHSILPIIIQLVETENWQCSENNPICLDIILVKKYYYRLRTKVLMQTAECVKNFSFCVNAITKQIIVNI